MGQFPNIQITSNRFLAPVFIEYAKADDPEWQPLSTEDVGIKVATFNELWKAEDDKILAGLKEALGLTFYESLIRVYIVPGQKGGFSDPIIISPNIAEDKFVDVLTHELIHRLVTFNAEGVDTGPITKKLFSDIENLMTSRHIMINATEKYIYLDILNDESRLRRNIEFMENYPALKKSWDIVEERGYKALLAEYKSHYRS